MSGQCLCSECVEARIWEREGGDDLRGLAAYDQARHAPSDRLGERLRQMREARERAGASCP